MSGPADTDYRNAARRMVLGVTPKAHPNRKQRVHAGHGGRWVEMWVWVPKANAEFERIIRLEKT